MGHSSYLGLNSAREVGAETDVIMRRWGREVTGLFWEKQAKCISYCSTIVIKHHGRGNQQMGFFDLHLRKAESPLEWGSMAAGSRHGICSESWGLELQAGSRKSYKTGMKFWKLKTRPQRCTPSIPCSLSLPKHHHQAGAKYSNICAYGSYSHPNDHNMKCA